MIFLDIFRWFGIIQAWWLYPVFFKCRPYYEDIPRGTRGPKHKNRRFKGGKLIISNHFSVVDYMLNLFVVLPRKLWVVASEHAYRNKLQAFGMMFFGGIPCDRRTRSMRFVERSVVILKKGGLVQIFPEGKNTDDGLIGPFYPSYILIAHRAGVPIVPILTDGNYGFRKKAHVLIGGEIRVEDYIKTEGPIIPREELKAANEAIRERVLALKAELDARVEAEKAEKSARRGKKARKDGT